MDEEASELGPMPEKCRSLGSAIRLIESNYDIGLLRASAITRADDLRVFFAAQQFQRRPPYKQLQPKLQQDIKSFFGDYRSAQSAGLQLLQETSDVSLLQAACERASEQGLGWINGEHSLQLHIDLVERLPAVLRAYVGCGLVLWDAIGNVELVKIHIGSGKLTLLEFDDFGTDPLPRLRRRVKVNLRKLDYDVFDYGSVEYPNPLLYYKSRYMHEDQPGYAEQKTFDDAIESWGLVALDGPAPSAEEFHAALKEARLAVKGVRLIRCFTIPDLDDRCGANFTYRSFIACGETQSRLGLSNLPLQPQTYNALHDLAVRIIDPIVDYFGAIKLTYGFCSFELSKHITKRVAHHLDQHAGFEVAGANKLICSRGGAACDFLVEDEDMEEVADWIIKHVPFDRLYFYGAASPVHVSYAERGERKAYRMVLTNGGRLMPRPYALARDT